MTSATLDRAHPFEDSYIPTAPPTLTVIPDWSDYEPLAASPSRIERKTSYCGS